jgi:hypothetical protein
VRKEPISHVSKAKIDKTIPKENTLTRVTRARPQRRNNFNTRTYQRRNPERAQLVHDAKTGEYLNYRQLLRNPKHKDRWETSSANEFGRLAQGVTRIRKENATNTINFILKDMVPKDRIKDVTYGSFRCDYKPNKEEQYRTRLTAGGDQINYPFDCGTPTADMTLFKIILNSTISTKGAKCLMIDLANFYLNTPMP